MIVFIGINICIYIDDKYLTKIEFKENKLGFLLRF